jgi:hypothetical protein
MSLRAIAAEIWERFGYASPKSAAVCLHDAFRREGYELRDRIEATRVASTKHGRAPRRGRDRSYKRWLREVRGDYQPICVGVKRNAPGRGRRCSLPASRGSVYCHQHDPNREQERRLHMASMRALRAAGDVEELLAA